VWKAAGRPESGFTISECPATTRKNPISQNSAIGWPLTLATVDLWIINHAEAACGLRICIAHRSQGPTAWWWDGWFCNFFGYRCVDVVQAGRSGLRSLIAPLPFGPAGMDMIPVCRLLGKSTTNPQSQNPQKKKNQE
jgi:hypothetical protein